MQFYITAISTWSENFLSSEVEYVLQNAKCVLFNMVLFDLDCTSFKMVEGSDLQNILNYGNINFEFYF